MLASTLRAATRVVKQSVPPHLTVTWATDTATLDKVFKMRYNAMVRNNQTAPAYSNVEHGNLMYDDLDFSTHTKHLSVIRDDCVISSIRIINANHNQIEAEAYDWYNIRDHHPEIGDNFVELSRLAIDPKHRGSYLFPLMMSHALCMAAEDEIDGVAFMTNARATKLIPYYGTITEISLLTETPIKINKSGNINGKTVDYNFCYSPLMAKPNTMPCKIMSAHIGYSAMAKVEMFRGTFQEKWK
jgi:predicted GNAT family N-acyltransferase